MRNSVVLLIDLNLFGHRAEMVHATGQDVG
jgi:hypothetical protein